MRALTVCVGYDRLLAITLPYTLRHVDELLVVTSPNDQPTEHLVRSYPDARVRLFQTAAFWAENARFNKGLAVELGFEELGRRGEILVLDADVVLPHVMPLPDPVAGCLWSPQRRILDDPSAFDDGIEWCALPLGPEAENGEHSGYFQLFDAADPAIAHKRPWYGTRWKTAGGCDSEFSWHWPHSRRRRPNFDVLHLGKPFANWDGPGRWQETSIEERAEQLARESRQMMGLAQHAERASAPSSPPNPPMNDTFGHRCRVMQSDAAGGHRRRNGLRP